LPVYRDILWESPSTECRSDGEPQLSGYVKTRCYSAGTCIQSVLQNENALRRLANNHEAELSANIHAIIANCQFWADCQDLVTVLHPLISLIGSLESNSATLADCYLQLLNLAAAIHNLAIGPAEFAAHCMAAFCHHWADLDDNVYRLAYFLHPGMHGKGIAPRLFGTIAETAAALWKDFGNGKQSTMKLLSQLMKYNSGDAPYNLPFAGGFMTPNLWWESAEDCIGSELKTLAIRLLSVTPHSAACERTFSIFGWIHSKTRNRLQLGRLEAMGKMYLYYVSHNNSDSHHASPTECQAEQMLNNCYAEEADNSVDEVVMSDENSCLEPDDNDRDTWALVKQNFDLCVFNLGIGETTSTTVPNEATEEVLNDRDDHDFNVWELVSMCQSTLLQQNEHSYA